MKYNPSFPVCPNAKNGKVGKFPNSREEGKAPPMPFPVKTRLRPPGVSVISTNVPEVVVISVSSNVIPPPKSKNKLRLVREKKSNVPLPGSSKLNVPVPTMGGVTGPRGPSEVSSKVKSKVMACAEVAVPIRAAIAPKAATPARGG